MRGEGTHATTGEAARAAETVAAGTSLSLTLTPPHARGNVTETPAAGRARAGRGGGIPNAAEQSRLTATLGAVLRELRADAGMTQDVLGARAGVARRSVQDLEGGRRRPSSAMLQALAVGLTRTIPPCRADWEPLFARLQSAAGGSLVTDSPGGVRRRERRLRDAKYRYELDLDAWWHGECVAAQRAELAFVQSMRLLELPDALDRPELLEASAQAYSVFRTWLHQGRPGPWGTTREFYRLARSHGYPVRRRGRAA